MLAAAYVGFSVVFAHRVAGVVDDGLALADTRYYKNVQHPRLLHTAAGTAADEAKVLYNPNAWAALAVMQAFAPMIIRAKGVIFNVSSISAIFSFAWACR